MSVYLDKKYINMIAQSLPRFHWQKDSVATCRCPVCGDSEKNKSKTRFYFFVAKNIYFVKCHNCGYANSFSRFLEQVNKPVYDDYLLEILKDKYGEQPVAAEKMDETELELVAAKSAPAFQPISRSLLGDSLDKLPEDHPAVVYVSIRQIPKNQWHRLHHTNDFSTIASEFDQKVAPDERLLIPFYNQSGEMFALQGRALNVGPNTIRYVTLRVPDRDDLKIYGMETVDISKPVYIVEGPLDSLFLPNAVAFAGASVDLSRLPIPKENIVFVYDNEPYNREICKLMIRVAQANYKVCVWPTSIEQKDINDMVTKGGLTNIKEIIDNNTFTGLRAHLEISQWRRK